MGHCVSMLKYVYQPAWAYRGLPMLSCTSQHLLAPLARLTTPNASYDTHGVFSSPRALYMFRAFGHQRSSILDGGLPGWQAHGGGTEHGKPTDVSSSEYPTPTLNQEAVKGVSTHQFDGHHYSHPARLPADGVKL